MDKDTIKKQLRNYGIILANFKPDNEQLKEIAAFLFDVARIIDYQETFFINCKED